VAAALIAGCSGPEPIDTGNPVAFKHRIGVFSLLAPESWQQSQGEVETEAIASFADPSARSVMYAYAGLLDHRLLEDEGLEIVADLAETLLNSPSDYQVVNRQRRDDGAFEVQFSYVQQGQKWLGRATFRDTDLALSGVIAAGQESTWANLSTALQPFVESFKVDPEAIQGTFFVPLEGASWAMAVPGDWARRSGGVSAQLTSRTGRMSILISGGTLEQPLDAAGLADRAAGELRQAFGLNVQVSASESQPDGRAKAIFERGEQRIIGYLEQGPDAFVGLFFQVPADRVADYQPFIDFERSVFVTFLE
jgi:hypothetical protein